MLSMTRCHACFTDPYTYRFSARRCAAAQGSSVRYRCSPINRNRLGAHPGTRRPVAAQPFATNTRQENFICFALRCRQGSAAGIHVFFSGGTFSEACSGGDSMLEATALSRNRIVAVEPTEFAELTRGFRTGSQTLSQAEGMAGRDFVMAGERLRFSLRGSKKRD